MTYVAPAPEPNSQQRAVAADLFDLLMREAGAYDAEHASKIRRFNHLGYYALPSTAYEAMRRLALDTVALLRHSARCIRNTPLLRSARQARLPAAEADLYRRLERLAPDTNPLDCFSIRLDLILQGGDPEPRVLEVNVNNIAGSQVCHYHLDWLLRWHDAEPLLPELNTQHLRRDRDHHLVTFVGGICSYLERYRRDAEDVVAYVYLDSESFFLAHYSVHLINSVVGRRCAVAVTPKDVGQDGDRLWVQVDNDRLAVGLLYRDFVYQELLADDLPNADVLRLIEGAARTNTPLLPLLSDRYVDLKDLLAEISTDTGPLAETWRDAAFAPLVSAIRPFVPPSILLTSDRGVFVKPIHETGANGVQFVSENLSIAQGQVTPELFRMPDGRDWHFVHGAIVYTNAQGESQFSGVFTRAAPGPIVSFKQGAQVVPTLVADGI